jgi:hypothetical protein
MALTSLKKLHHHVFVWGVYFCRQLSEIYLAEIQTS